MLLLLLAPTACGDGSGPAEPPQDLEPRVSIEAPQDESSVGEGIAVEFAGTADDPEDGSLTSSIEWTSDQDGDLGVGGTLAATLSVGTHTITASVTDSGDNTATAMVTVRVRPSGAATVLLDPDMPAATRSQVTEIVAIGGEKPGAGPHAIPLPEGTRETPVFALDAHGNALFAAMAAEDHQTILGAPSTAILLVRFAAGLAGLNRPQAVDSLASLDARLPALVETVREAAGRGSSFTDSETAFEQAAQIALDVGPAAEPEDDGAASGRDGHRVVSRDVEIPFPQIQVTVQDGPLASQGLDYSLENSTYVFWDAVSVDARTGDRIDRTLLARRQVRLALRLSWRAVTGPPVATLLGGRNGLVTITLEQSDSTRTRINQATIEGIVDIVGTTFTALFGLGAGDGLEQVKGELIAQLTAHLVEDGYRLSEGLSPTAVIDALADVIISNPAEVTDYLIDALGGTEEAIQKALKAWLGSWTRVAKIGWTAGKLGFLIGDFYALLRDKDRYAEIDDAITVCQQDGVLLASTEACQYRLVVEPSTATVVEGATVTLSARVIDSSGNPQPTRVPEFQSLNPGIATVRAGSQTGSAIVTGAAPGDATIRVTYVPEDQAWGDGLQTDVTVTVTSSEEPPPPTSDPDPVAGDKGSTFDDPHIRTVDRRYYDFHAVGDYVLSRSTGPDDDFEVHVRYRPMNDRVSLVDAVAARVEGDVVNLFPLEGAFDVIINDETIDATSSLERKLPGGGSLRVNRSFAAISWPDRTVLKVKRRGADLLLAYSRSGSVEGLLGNYDGDPANDVQVRDGPQLDPDLTGLYGAFRDSWRVPFGSSGSLFRRGPELWDEGFPHGVVKLSDFDPSEIAAAREVCRAAGVTSERMLDTCAFDILVTGDESWAEVSVTFDPSIPTVTIAPSLVYMRTGETHAFTASVTGVSSRSTSWSATDGAIEMTAENGMSYTAPSAPGEYLVIARSDEAAGVADTAKVVVAADTGAAKLANGANHTGSISEPDEVDTWTFTAEAGDAISLRAAELEENGPLRPWMRLLAPDGEQLDSDVGSVVSRIDTVVPATGTYTVLMATGDNGGYRTGNYRITLAKIPGEFEVPEDDEGGTLANGANHDATIPVGDLDLWTFAADSGDAISLRAGEVGGNGSLRPWMRLFRPNGEQIDSNEGSQVSQVDLSVPATGIYTVLLASGGTLGNGTGDYRLTLAKIPGEFEVPEDDEGGTLANGANHDATIPLGDLDLWTFAADSGDAVSLRAGEVGGNGSLRPWIRLYGPDGQPLDSNEGSVVGQIDVSVSAAGIYTVLLASGGTLGNGDGDYQLTLAKIPGEFEVPEGDEGGALVNGAPDPASIHVGDLDLWTLTAGAGEGITVSAEEPGQNTALRPWIRIFGPDGQLLDSESGSTAARVDVTAAVAGTYTVLVASSDAGGDGNGDYTILWTTPGTSGATPP